tara:strand:+ start:351 stop:566 length:216 start_codon:yes stop_codon:yes gene_type:complete
MAERQLAYIILDFKRSLDQFKSGDIEIDQLSSEFEKLKTSVGGIVSRYCDDFSSSEYHAVLKQLEGKDATK